MALTDESKKALEILLETSHFLRDTEFVSAGRKTPLSVGRN